MDAFKINWIMIKEMSGWRVQQLELGVLLGTLENRKTEFLKFSSLFWNFIRLGKEVRLNPNCSHPLTYPPCFLPGKIFDR